MTRSDMDDLNEEALRIGDTVLPKFKIGDKVFTWSVVSSKKEEECVDCKGSGLWSVKSPAGYKSTVSCPRCDGSGKMSQFCYGHSVQALTIGSIRTDTDSQHPVEYMCLETGVGSGTVHKEKHLFADKANAQADAVMRAHEANRQMENKQPERAEVRGLWHLKFEDAKIKEANDARDRARRLGGKLLDRICELDCHPVAHRRYEQPMFASLNDDQVLAIQQALVCIDDELADYFDDWIKEDAKT